MELAVEDIPLLPRSWSAPRCRWPRWCGRRTWRRPGWCSTAGRSSSGRRPAADLDALVLTVLVEQLADYLGVPAEDVHPGYEP